MKKVVKILSLDGGGSRGIIPALVLVEVEKITGKPISQLFDLVAGTSTGSVLALSYTLPGDDGKPLYSAQDNIDFYEKEMDFIFPQSFLRKLLTLGAVRDSKYPHDNIIKSIKRYFGGHHLKDQLTEVLVPAFEIETSREFFFTRRAARAEEKFNFGLDEVVLSSTAAPTYFKPFEVKIDDDPLVKHYAFVDGGLVAYNPAMCAYIEAKTIFPHADEYLILSMGTGLTSAQLLFESVDKWGIKNWVRPLVAITMAGNGELVDFQLRTLLSSDGDRLNYYFRLQPPPPPGSMSLDETDPMKLHAMKVFTDNYIHDNQKLIEKICGQLLKYS